LFINDCCDKNEDDADPIENEYKYGGGGTSPTHHISMLYVKARRWE